MLEDLLRSILEISDQCKDPEAQKRLDDLFDQYYEKERTYA